MLNPKHERKIPIIVLMRLARQLNADFRLLQIAVSCKFSTMIKGTSPVSISCQIPNLRERYESLGLNPHTGYFVELGAFDSPIKDGPDCILSLFPLSVHESSCGIYLILIGFPSIIRQ